MGAQYRAGEKDVIDSEVRPTSGADRIGGIQSNVGIGKVGMTQTQTSHHHILSPREGVEGNSQTYPWVNVSFVHLITYKKKKNTWNYLLFVAVLTSRSGV